jgi:hypothetical protein
MGDDVLSAAFPPGMHGERVRLPSEIPVVEVIVGKAALR